MITPRRIQRSRKRGFRTPENTIYVGRGSRWGNPFIIGIDGDATEVVRKYSKMMMPYTHQSEDGMNDFYISLANIEDIQISLGGKNLSCWCKIGEPCHADVLLSIANDPHLGAHLGEKEKPKKR